MADQKSRKGARTGRRPFHTARLCTVVFVVAFVLVGLIFKVGTGTPSSFGWYEISAICPLGGLEAICAEKGVSAHLLLLVLFMVVVVVVIGKAYCAWMCPVPWLQRLFGGGKKKDGKKGRGRKEGDAAAVSEAAQAGGAKQAAPAAQASGGCEACGKGCGLSPVGGARDGLQLDTRHAVLAGSLCSAAVFGFPVFCLVCPVGLTFATIIGLWHLFQFSETSWGLIIFPVILILELTVLRKWCAKICPIGALVSLLSNLNFTLRPRVKAESCLRSAGTDCHVCVDACPEQLDPHTGHIPECSKCGVCVESCPAGAIGFKLLGK